MRTQIHTFNQFDCQTAMSLAWSGIICTRGSILRSYNNPEKPGREAGS